MHFSSKHRPWRWLENCCSFFRWLGEAIEKWSRPNTTKSLVFQMVNHGWVFHMVNHWWVFFFVVARHHRRVLLLFAVFITRLFLLDCLLSMIIIPFYDLLQNPFKQISIETFTLIRICTESYNFWPTPMTSHPLLSRSNTIIDFLIARRPRESQKSAIW